MSYLLDTCPTFACQAFLIVEITLYDIQLHRGLEYIIIGPNMPKQWYDEVFSAIIHWTLCDSAENYCYKVVDNISWLCLMKMLTGGLPIILACLSVRLSTFACERDISKRFLWFIGSKIHFIEDWWYNKLLILSHCHIIKENYAKTK